jgi:hypothetical protein
MIDGPFKAEDQRAVLRRAIQWCAKNLQENELSG